MRFGVIPNTDLCETLCGLFMGEGCAGVWSCMHVINLQGATSEEPNQRDDLLSLVIFLSASLCFPALVGALSPPPTLFLVGSAFAAFLLLSAFFSPLLSVSLSRISDVKRQVDALDARSSSEKKKAVKVSNRASLLFSVRRRVSPTARLQNVSRLERKH